MAIDTIGFFSNVLEFYLGRLYPLDQILYIRVN